MRHWKTTKPLKEESTPYNRLFWRQITVSTTDADGEDFLFAKFQQTNLWGPTGNAEDANCLEIMQQQSEPISRTNKLFIS